MALVAAIDYVIKEAKAGPKAPSPAPAPVTDKSPAASEPQTSNLKLRFFPAEKLYMAAVEHELLRTRQLKRRGMRKSRRV